MARQHPRNDTTGTKSSILDAASTLFLEGGVGALSVRAIAAKAGVSTIGIYSHFQGKQGILDTLYIEGFERVSRAMDVPLDNMTPREAVMQAARNYLDSANTFEAHYRLIFGESDGGYRPSAEAQAVGAHAFGTLTNLVATLLPADAAPARQQDAAIRVWSVLHGFVSLKNHAVTQLVDMRGWERRALNTLETVIDAVPSAQDAMNDQAAPGPTAGQR